MPAVIGCDHTAGLGKPDQMILEINPGTRKAMDQNQSVRSPAMFFPGDIHFTNAGGVIHGSRCLLSKEGRQPLGAAKTSCDRLASWHT
jgi:hypothetical protein